MEFDYTGFSILHGEDDPTDVALMQRMLKNMGYNGDYLSVDLGPDIVAWSHDVRNEIPGLIFLDIGLPKLDGKSVLVKLRDNERTSSVPVIIMSGSNSLRDYKECLHLGANAYIKKSSDRTYFLNVCQNFIQGWTQLNNQKFL